MELLKGTQLNVVCDQCGKEFIRRRSQVIRNPHHFCGKECRARWRGLHHGFHVHPENCMKTVRKYDYDAIWQKHLETGYNARNYQNWSSPIFPSLRFTRFWSRCARNFPTSTPIVRTRSTDLSMPTK